MTDRNIDDFLVISDDYGELAKSIASRIQAIVVDTEFILSSAKEKTIPDITSGGDSLFLMPSPAGKGRFHVTMRHVIGSDPKITIIPSLNGEQDPKGGIKLLRGEIICFLLKSEPKF